MKTLTSEERTQLLATLKTRFEKHMHRHAGLDWADVQARLESHDGKISVIAHMEQTGGEPDIIGIDPDTKAYIYCDCSVQSPTGRRSLCYDRQALDGRKEHKPVSSALDVALEIGIELLTEDEYRQLQALEEFDTKTSSWIVTPGAIRTLGGAVFADRRYDTVFVYHNGADSYYASRGFRGKVLV